MLSRLVAKGALGTERYKNLFLYRPKIDREDCVRSESDSFLRKVFGGALQPLLVHFASRENLTDEEARDLKRLLSQKKK
jgi:BlaI family penicillinase repressor